MVRSSRLCIVGNDRIWDRPQLNVKLNLKCIRTVRPMAKHFLLHHKCDDYRACGCRSLNEQIMCQITFEVHGCSSNRYLNHESSNFMHSGNRRRGWQKPKIKDEKHSQDSRGCILRMLVAQREHHRQESVLVERTMVGCISYIFYSC